MALTRKQKMEILKKYKSLLERAKNVVVMKMFAIPVNEINKVRKEVISNGGKLQVVKKRLFIRALKESGYESIDLDKLDGSIIVLYSLDEEFKPLKSVNKFKKQWKRDGQKYYIEYLGGFYDKQWKEAAYVMGMAELPTKEELVGKFVFLIRYPIQSFVMNLKQITEKQV